MFERSYRFGYYACAIVLAPVARWFFGLLREAISPKHDATGNEVIMSRALSVAAGHRLGLIASSLHAAGVGLRAALPIGFDAHKRRAGVALA